MKLILVRHAEAEGEFSTNAEFDFQRTLTKRGHKQALHLATALKELDIVADVLVSSPLVRAHQTADKLSSLLDNRSKDARLTWDCLQVHTSQPRMIAKEVSALQVNCAILVGHLPSLPMFAAWLLGMKPTNIDFKKAAAMCLEIPTDKLALGCGTLSWFVTPKWCK